MPFSGAEEMLVRSVTLTNHIAPASRKKFFSRLFMRMGGMGDSARFDRYGGIAQLVEHELCKLGATGSSPVASTFGRVAQLVRARP